MSKKVSVANVGRLDLIQWDPYEIEVSESAVHLVIDPSERFCRLMNHWRQQGSTYEEAHGLHLLVDVTSMDGVLDGPAVVELLCGKAGQALLKRVCDGHYVEWDGIKSRGRLNADANAAIDELTDFLANVPALSNSSAGVWHASDWLYDEDEAREKYGITAETTDERIAEIVAQIVREAKKEDVVLHWIDEYVMELRDQLREEN